MGTNKRRGRSSRGREKSMNHPTKKDQAKSLRNWTGKVETHWCPSLHLSFFVLALLLSQEGPYGVLGLLLKVLSLTITFVCLWSQSSWFRTKGLWFWEVGFSPKSQFKVSAKWSVLIISWKNIEQVAQLFVLMDKLCCFKSSFSQVRI